MSSLFGGKSDDSSSREMINMQKEEAAKADQKEKDRQARINKGLADITAAFTGKNEYKTVKNNPYKVTAPGAGVKSGDAVKGLPTGFKYVQQPGTPARAGTPGISGALVNPPRTPATTPAKATATAAKKSTPRFTANDLRNSAMESSTAYSIPAPRGSTASQLRDSAMTVDTGSPRVSQNDGFGGVYNNRATQGTAGTAATPGKWVVQGPDGKFYEVGSSIDQGSKNVFTGRKIGGVGEGLYNEFRQAFLDYYQPQVADKYAAATNETNFRLARAGTLRSTASTNAIADLVKQNKINTADIRDKADKATGDLRTRVESEKAKAISQLYATENPEVAANQATTAVNNIVAATPDTTPLGDIFSLAAIGGAKYLQGRDNADFNKRIGAAAKPATSIVR